MEPSFGVGRAILALLCDAYEEEQLENGEIRTLLRLDKAIAPVKVAVLPLSKKDDLVEIARSIHKKIKALFITEYDQKGAIGKRYRRQDEIGTPYAITVDFDTLSDNSVTIRERDSMKQDRIKIDDIVKYLQTKLLS